MTTNRILAAGMAAMAALPAWAWGQKGHDVTAYIAECHLTPAARAAAGELLDGKSIVYWSNWLDNASHQPEYAYSKTWHYKNIDSGVPYAEAPKHPAGDVVEAIREQSRILADSNAPREERQLALKMLVHLVGDVHQPMHVGHASDLGGNKWPVKYFGRNTNLHSVWDSSLPEGAHKWSYTEWQQQTDRLHDAEQAEVTSVTDPSQWAEETFGIATMVYNLTPPGTDISYDYVAEWAPVVEQQFVRGGLRLATLLNSILDN